MKLRPKIFLIVVLFMSAAGVCAQQPKLKGKVALHPSERGIQIKINVRDRATGGLIPGEQIFTKVEDWFHVVPLNAEVDVEFDGGKCYRGNGHPPIRVKQLNEELPTVKLLKSRECKIQELRQARRNNSKSIRVESGSQRRSSATQSMEEALAVVNFSDYALKMELSWVPSSEVLKNELEDEAKHARNGEFFDTFQYKFALSSELYRNRPELAKVLTDFRAKQENAVLFQNIGKVKPEMFADVVRRELGEQHDNVNFANVFAIVKEEAVSANARGAATVALVDSHSQLSPDHLAQMLEYYRLQSPSSPIFANALIALARIGKPEDHEKLYAYIKDKSVETRLTAMEALYLATLIKGPDAFPDGAETLADVATDKKEDPVVRAFAYNSLRSFVDGGDETAVEALLDGVKDPSPTVRLQVVLALGVGKIEQTNEVEKALRRVLSKDRSAEVRQAARLSLDGTKTDQFALREASAATAKLIASTEW